MKRISILIILALLLTQLFVPQSTEACGCTPKIYVTPRSIDFGNVPVGSLSAPQTVTISNVGTAGLYLISVQIIGSDAGSFIITSAPSLPRCMVPHTSVTVVLQFQPNSIGYKSARLCICSDDSTSSPLYVTLSGTGTMPIEPDILVEPTSIDFGNVPVDTDSADRTVTVTNTGNLDLVIGTLDMSDSQFTISGSDISGDTLGPGEWATISLVFHPTAAGAQSADLTIPSNDPDENPVYVHLVGTGTRPDISVTPETVDFGDVPLDTESAPQTVTVKNTGNSDLTIGTLDISDGQFTIDSGDISGDTLGPDESADISLVFKPTATGPQEAILTIPSNDPDDNPVYVHLIGNATKPEISAEPDSVDFDSVPVGTESAPQTVTVRNIGDADLIISSLTIDDPQFAFADPFTDDISGQTLAPGDSATIHLVFKPTAAGPQTGKLTITSNDIEDSPLDISLYGNATVPLISIEPASINFGKVLVDTTSTTRTVTITNAGTASLTILNLTISDSQFSLASTSDNISGLTLAPSEFVTIYLVFTPTATGAQSANLTITSNDPDKSSVDVALSGTGTLQQISVEPDSLDFGDVLRGTTSPAKSVRVTNTGSANLTIGTLTIDNDRFAFANPLTDDISGLTLGPGEWADIYLVFSPDATGPQTGKLTVPSDDPATPAFEVELSGNGTAPQISVEPESIEFGEVLVGTSSAPHDVMVTNTGTADLTIGMLDISDGQFTIDSGDISGQTLAPSASATISLVFTPTTAGAQSADLTIPSDDPDTPTITVHLTGIGKTEPNISVDPTSVNFSYVQIGHPSATKTVTVKNTGSAKLIIYSVGTSDSQFAVTGGIGADDTLAPGASATISLVFTPTAAGTQSANLTITSNDPDTPTLDVPLSGIGNEGPVEPNIAVTPTSVGFGTVPVGSSSAVLDVTVTNEGTADLIIGTLDISDSGQFTIDSGDISGDTLGHGDSAIISLVFEPITIGLQEAFLSIPSNDPDTPTLSVPLSGTGIIFNTDLEITKTDSQDPVVFGDDFTYTLMVTNHGPDYATGVAVTDPLPPYVNFISASASVGIPTVTDGTLRWNIGDLASEDSATLDIVVTLNLVGVTTGGSFTNTATVIGNEQDPEPDNNSASETTTILTTDLQITKTASPDIIGLTDNVTWVVTVTNNGSEDATNVMVIDAYMTEYTNIHQITPSAGTIVTTPPAWLADLASQLSLPIDPPPTGMSILLWDIGDLASGASVSMTIEAAGNFMLPIPPDLLNLLALMGPATLPNFILTNGAIVLSTMGDSNFTDNSAYVTTPTETFLYADLSITKSGTPDTVAPGDDITYTITVHNNGPEDAEGVFVVDGWLSAQLSFKSAIPSPDTMPSWLADFLGTTPGVDYLYWYIGDLASGATATLTVTATVNAEISDTSPIINEAVVSGPDIDENTSNNITWTINNIAQADLAITKNDSPDPVATNGNLTYTLTVTNNGPADATGVIVYDELPAGTIYQSNDGGATYDSDTRTVTWDVGDLAYGTSATLTIIVTAPESTGTITNTASVTGNENDPVMDNNSASESTYVALPSDVDLEITKSDSPDPVATNGNLTYTLMVTNNGPADATSVIVYDELPAGTIYQSNDGGATYDSGTHTVTWDVGRLDVGESAILTIIVTAPSEEGTITNTATATAVDVNDPIPDNNTATEDTNVIYVQMVTDLQIAKTDDPDPVVAGNDLTYTITVTNNGPDNATGVMVTDTLPGDIIYQSDTPSTGTTSYDSGNITWDVGNLAYGESATLTIVVTAPDFPDTLANNASVSGNEIDLMQANNTVITGTFVLPASFAPDINVVPTSIDFGTVNVNSSSGIHNVIISNAGSITLDIYDLTIDNPQFTIYGGDISGHSLAPGASATVSLVFIPAIAGPQSGSLSITSNDPDESLVVIALSGTGQALPPPGPPPGPPEPTPTPTPTPEVNYFQVDFLGLITKVAATDDGRPVSDIAAPSPDGLHLLEIKALTGASANGNTVTDIVIREVQAPELPKNTQLVGQAYEFMPSGTTFDKPVTLTLGYNVNDLPEGVTSVGMAFYSSESGWIYLEAESSSVAELGKLTAPVNHFTIFAVLATVPETEPVPPEPTPTPTPTPAAPAQFSLNNLSITTSLHRVWENWSYIIRTGEDAVITADITNTGGQTGTYTAILLINGTERERKDITLGPGQTGTVSFTASGNEPGTYTVVIGNLSGNFLSEFWVNWWLIVGSFIVLILIAWLVWYIIQKRRQGGAPINTT
jgi:uncharacterized repeat protein (TIGR01451 family)